MIGGQARIGGFRKPGVPTQSEVVQEQASQSIYTHKLGNRTVTKAGKRYLVNEGTEGGEYLMQSGQGFAFDGTQKIATGTTLGLTKDFSILWSQEKKGGSGQSGSFNGVTGRAHFGVNASGIRVGIGAGARTLTVALTDGVIYDFLIRYKADSGVVDFGFLDLSARQEFNVGAYAALLELTIGMTSGGTDHVNGIAKDFFYIPHYLTDAESVMHQQQPENIIYIKNGVVRSAFLPQPVLDLMAAGNGFAYPLCENNGAGNLAYDISKPNHVGSTIVNYENSETKTTADFLDVGIQTALLEQDASGRVVGLAKTDLLNANNSLKMDLNVPLFGDWFVDIVVKQSAVNNPNNSEILAIQTDSDWITVYLSANQQSVKVRLQDIYYSEIASLDGRVISIECVSGVVRCYSGGLFERVSAIPVVSADILRIGGADGSAMGEFGAIHKGDFKRTDEERLATANKLMTKYGVTI